MNFEVLCIDFQIVDPLYGHAALREMERTLSRDYRDVSIVTTRCLRLNHATRRLFVEFFYAEKYVLLAAVGTVPFPGDILR